MKRVLLKLSGEALAGEKKTGFDEDTVMGIAQQVRSLSEKGIQIAVVTGGGNFWRGRTSGNMDRTRADQIGMLATVMNCIYVADIFRAAGMKTRVMTPFVCGSFTQLFSKEAAVNALEQGEIVFFCRRNRTSLLLNGYSDASSGDRDRGGCDPAGEGNRRRVRR